MLKQYRSKIILLICLFSAAMIAAAAVFFLCLFPGNMRNDFKRFSNESCNTVFLSMYTIENYDEEIYAYWRGMDTIVTAHEIPNLFTLKNYLRKINEAGTVTTIYLGVLPEKLDAAELTALLLSYPQIRFEVILPYPSLDYWLSLSKEKCDSLLQTYRDFIPPLLNHEMISPYFFGGAEWLIANPANYEDTFLTTAKISETLMLNSDRDHAYVLTAATQPSPTASIDTLAALIEENRTAPMEYPNLEGKRIVFFGDSVIGNYTGSTSIPGVTQALTGAQTYNLGYGGGTLTKTAEDDSSFVSLVSAFLAQDSTKIPAGESEKPFFAGLKEFIKDEAEPYAFIINYGLNDYFTGAPIASDDPYDTHTFTGAFRTTIQALRKTYPDAHIMVATPNLSVLFNYGADVNSAHNHVLTDYVNALIELSAELDVVLLDNYNELGITAENWTFFLADGTHPNETGRFLMGRRIAEKLKSFEIYP